MMKVVYLSLGSNVGDRESELQSALRRLHSHDLQIKRVSSLYETAPVDVVAQPQFLNCVVEAHTTLFPMRLLLRIAQIERDMGRKRIAAKGPRNIDIDILLFGKFVVDTPQLTVPHARMTERRFVLAPLAELAPELRHPVLRKTVREMLAAAPNDFVRRLDHGLLLPSSVD